MKIWKVLRIRKFVKIDENLGYCKLCSRWVLKMLMEICKTKQLDSAQAFLIRHKNEVTSNETQVFQITQNPHSSLWNEDTLSLRKTEV
ncbi:hypothetical protein PR048_028784 [Dryococelus australis]|uniref:Uncharacterized protein n=1 Tax=Dryococelus australis TaxID=614101 RepID=A0ABQ9GFB2_9NEOP|nr:hypothetical protein PR048_028784 [Dryococelus australis]